MTVASPLARAAPIRKHRQSVPAVWMRAGTSKGLFLHRCSLPKRRDDWGAIILPVMGSHDGDPRQLSGIGGATSTTSKVAVVEPSVRPGIDVEYTFVQVGIGGPKLDFTGNCGNIASGVGPFALDEGLVVPKAGQGQIDVRILNTNTGRVLTETLDVDEDGHFLEDGDYLIPGTLSSGSRINVAFEHPAGAMTGSLLPSGNVVDHLEVVDAQTLMTVSVRASLVDAANPFVLVDDNSLPQHIRSLDLHSPTFLIFIERVRQAGAVRMGLASDLESAALTRGTPKIAVLSTPKIDGIVDLAGIPDVRVTALSMGNVHGSLQLTGAVCLSVAVCTEGTIAYEIAEQVQSYRKALSGERRDSAHENDSSAERKVLIQHPGGVIDVGITMDGDEISSARLSRTARRLFEGNVCFLA